MYTHTLHFVGSYLAVSEIRLVAPSIKINLPTLQWTGGSQEKRGLHAIPQAALITALLHRKKNRKNNETQFCGASNY